MREVVARERNGVIDIEGRREREKESESERAR